MTLQTLYSNYTNGFNPLTGIRCFLTRLGRYQIPEAWPVCFNPLAGIRCFLTDILVEVYGLDVKSFNPLAGIRCFLTGLSRVW